MLKALEAFNILSLIQKQNKFRVLHFQSTCSFFFAFMVGFWTINPKVPMYEPDGNTTAHGFPFPMLCLFLLDSLGLSKNLPNFYDSRNNCNFLKKYISLNHEYFNLQ